MVRSIIRLEGLAVFLFSLYFYQQLSDNWILFFLLFLIPDVSMIGYSINKKIGAIVYNCIHNYLLSFLLISLAVVIKNQLLLECSLILMAHVGVDRFCGFGLKYFTDFQHTHIQKL